MDLLLRGCLISEGVICTGFNGVRPYREVSSIQRALCTVCEYIVAIQTPFELYVCVKCCVFTVTVIPELITHTCIHTMGV